MASSYRHAIHHIGFIVSWSEVGLVGVFSSRHLERVCSRRKSSNWSQCSFERSSLHTRRWTLVCNLPVISNRGMENDGKMLVLVLMSSRRHLWCLIFFRKFKKNYIANVERIRIIMSTVQFYDKNNVILFKFPLNAFIYERAHLRLTVCTLLLLGLPRVFGCLLEIFGCLSYFAYFLVYSYNFWGVFHCFWFDMERYQ